MERDEALFCLPHRKINLNTEFRIFRNLLAYKFGYRGEENYNNVILVAKKD